MSYQVIARKWRPQSFGAVTGQEHVTKTLRNAIENGRLHHAYLFSGARGVGKTTTARLLAKALNCHKSDRPTVTPCDFNDPNACSSCVEIAEGRSMDVLEIDAASHTGIDSVRDTIIEGINVNPARDRYKVFIIDEVHQLSKPAFNALLKTLEEPPPTVVFVMATTELHKVPDTILSRCQQFEFRTIPISKILEKLRSIAEAEDIVISEDALREVARSGEGSMRDAQSNLDQVISFAEGSIERANVSAALGLAGTEFLEASVRAISETDPSAVLKVVDELTAHGYDLRNYCRDLLGILRDLLVYKIAGGNEHLLEGSPLTVNGALDLAEPFSESDLVRLFESLAQTEIALKDALQPRYVLEIGLIKLLEMRRLSSLESILDRLSNLETGVSNGTADPVVSDLASADLEKKTLISPPTSPESLLDIETAVAEGEPHRDERPPVDLSFLDHLPVKLPPIPSEELEHFQDNWLDDRYEQILLENGDDLSLLKSVIIPDPVQPNVLLSQIKAEQPANGYVNEAAATVRALVNIPETHSVPQEYELPTLPLDPSEDDLINYARAHPSTILAMKIFRASIVGVERR
ncbi:MAG: DNA polymerase III subunit gamma/tau [Acidobacteriota bacterium]